MSFSHITNTADDMHEAMLQLNTRNKEMTDADITHDERPSPMDPNGTIENSGSMTLTNTKLYRMGSTPSEISVTSTIPMGSTANYALGSVDYGDHLLIVSDQDFWGVEASPVPHMADGVLNKFVEGSIVSMTRLVTSPMASYEPLDTLNINLNDAVQNHDDDINYTVDMSEEEEYKFYVGSCQHSPSSQIVIRGRKLGNDPDEAYIDIWPWDGIRGGWWDTWFSDPAYECKFDSEDWTECSTDSLANQLIEDNGYMRVKIEPKECKSWWFGCSNYYDDFEIDYVHLDVICII